MKFTNYMIVIVAVVFVLLFIVGELALAAIPEPAAGDLVGTVVVVSLISLGITFLNTRRAMDDFGGTPCPGVLGVVGVDILPDEGFRTLAQDEADRRRFNPTLAERGRSTRPTSSASPTAPAVNHRGCSQCGAVTAGADSKFCRVCGQRLERET
jgi:hypothetical protein